MLRLDGDSFGVVPRGRGVREHLVGVRDGDVDGAGRVGMEADPCLVVGLLMGADGEAAWRGGVHARTRFMWAWTSLSLRRPAQWSWSSELFTTTGAWL